MKGLRTLFLIPLVLPASAWAHSKPIAPCAQIDADTTGWRAERFDIHRLFLLPSDFKRDPSVQCVEGCVRWIRGKQWVEWSREYGMNEPCSHAPERDHCSDCVDTLVGGTFRLVTRYNPYYRRDEALAIPGTEPLDAEPILIASSTEVKDLPFLLGIVRTVRPEGAGVLAGVVTDKNGKPLCCCTVSVRGVRDVATDDHGRFYANVPVGTYKLRCTRKDFPREDRDGVHVSPHETTIVNFNLKGIAPESSP